MLAPNKNYVDLSKPSVAGLAYALRHKEVWPEGFNWYFPSCMRCALGLAYVLWGRQFEGPTSPDIMVGLGMAQNDMEAMHSKDRDIFFDCVDDERCIAGKRLPKPEDIAERLEKLLDARRS